MKKLLLKIQPIPRYEINALALARPHEAKRMRHSDSTGESYEGGDYRCQIHRQGSGHAFSIISINGLQCYAGQELKL
jgi:hypothetical protein